jgi:hypothetical protein
MPTGGGGTRPADAGQATASCSGGHPQAPAVSAVRTPTVRTPTLWTPTAVPGAAVDRQGVRGVRFRSHPDSGRGVRRRQAGGRPRSRRCGATAGPRRSDLLVGAGQVARATQPGENGCPDGWTPDALPNSGSPHAPALPTPATAAGHGGAAAAATLTAGSRTVHHPAAGPGERWNPASVSAPTANVSPASGSSRALAPWPAPARSRGQVLATSSRPAGRCRPARSAGRPRRKPGSARASGHAARTHRRSSCRRPHTPPAAAW